MQHGLRHVVRVRLVTDRLLHDAKWVLPAHANTHAAWLVPLSCHCGISPQGVLTVHAWPAVTHTRAAALHVYAQGGLSAWGEVQVVPKTREQLYQESRKKVQRAGTDYPHMDTCQVGGGWGCRKEVDMDGCVAC